jgi:hypothetical protein
MFRNEYVEHLLLELEFYIDTHVEQFIIAVYF